MRFHIAVTLCLAAAAGCSTVSNPNIVAGDPDHPNLRMSEEAWKGKEERPDRLLSTVPISVELKSSDKDSATVVVTNLGQATLRYDGEGRRHIALCQQTYDGSSWHAGAFARCGVGLSSYDLKPGESATLDVRFLNPHGRERMLGWFYEKETNKHVLIVLASETSPQ